MLRVEQGRKQLVENSVHNLAKAARVDAERQLVEKKQAAVVSGQG